jgi:hypothetical protein
MAFSKARRLSDFIAADGTIPTGNFASSTITSAHLVDGTIAHADLHTNMDLTGKTVLVANASTGDSDTTAANTAFVQQEIAALVDSSPSALNTLNELAAALGDDANFSTTVTNSIGTKLPLAGGTMTGALIVDAGNSGLDIRLGTDKRVIWAGNLSEIGSTAGFQAVNTAGSALSGFGIRASELKFATGSATRLTIDATGDVTVPGKVLVNTDIRLGSEGVRLSSDGNGEFGIGYGQTATNSRFTVYNNTAVAFRVLPNGNIGIGTGVASSRLHVHSTADTQIRISADNSMALHQDAAWNSNMYFGAYYDGSNIVYGNTGRGAFRMVNLHDGDSSPQYIAFYGANAGTAGNTVSWNGVGLAMDEDGNVGIGTNNPGSKLVVYNDSITGNTQLHVHNNKSGDAAVLKLEGARTSNNDAAQVLFANSGNVIARIDSESSADSGNIRFFTSVSGTGSSVTQSMMINPTGDVDVSQTGSRISSYVQDSFHIGAEKSDNSRYGFSSTRTYADGGSSNYQGYVYGQENYFPQVFIPYSPNQVYRISASMYQLTGSNASGGASARHYFGLAGYDENFNFLQVDGIGTYQYILASNVTVNTGSVLEMDITMKGWNGSGQTDGNKMDQGTVYIRPLVLFNYATYGGTAVLTGFNIQPAGTIADNDSNAGTNY